MLEKIKKLIPRKIFHFLQPAYHYLMNLAAALAYKFPSQKLIVIGVTGTTGKTSSVYLIAKTLEASGYKVGYTSTAQFSDGDKEWLNDKKMTMVGRFFTQKLLRQMLLNGCQYAIVETTSEGIKQFRHTFISYDILVFTGLYPEHIESHGSFEKYKIAKGKLFKHLKNCRTKYVNEKKIVCRPPSELKKLDLQRVKKTIIVNGDDDYASYFLAFWSEAKLIYSASNWKSREQAGRHFKLDPLAKDWELIPYGEIKTSLAGTEFLINKENISLKLLGDFNAQNAVAAYTLALSQGLDSKQNKLGLESVASLAGKLEKIEAGQNFTVIVDYAFEPQALTRVYETLELFQAQHIIHVLGSTGGGRDKARRPELGRIAGARADYVIITNEDPYDDVPLSIISDVALGALEVGKEEGLNLFKILERREAIRKAFSLAAADDLVLISGKGAEQYICGAGGQKIPWDDRRVAREELQNLRG